MDRCTDTAAIGDGQYILHGNGHAVRVLLNRPQHGVGDQIAQIGLAVTVAVGRLGAVELHLALGKHRAVCHVHMLDYLICFRSHGGIGSQRTGHFIQEVIHDLLGGIVNDDHADIGKSRTGGLDGCFRRGLHHGMGVAVNDHVNTGGVIQHIIRGIGFGRRIHAQVGQADNHIGAGSFQRVYLRLCAVIQVLACPEGQALNQRRIGLGLCLGRLHTEEADLYAALFNDGVGLKDGRTALQHIGTDDLKGRFIGVGLELFPAIVELMVADGRHIVADSVHHVEGILALCDAHIGCALGVVTGISQNDLCAFALVLIAQRSHIGIPFNGTVDII